MADTARAYSIDVQPNGIHGGAIVLINGEQAGRIGAPWWGRADNPEDRLLTAHDMNDDQIGDTRGMSYDEARSAIVERWKATEDVPTTPREWVRISRSALHAAQAGRLLGAAVASVEAAARELADGGADVADLGDAGESLRRVRFLRDQLRCEQRNLTD